MVTSQQLDTRGLGYLLFTLVAVLAACGSPEAINTPSENATPATHATFPIRAGDVHEFIGCDRCHPTGTSSLSCFACHAEEVTVNFHDGIFGFAYESRRCVNCHFDGTTFPKDSFFHDPFPIEQGTHSQIECDDCHFEDSPRSVEGCTRCHGGETRLDPTHIDVGGYSFDGSACYFCHPNGTG